MNTYVNTHVNVNNKFVVIIVTYWRKNRKTKSYLNRIMAMLKKQTCPDFDIFLIGDKYEKEAEFNSICKSMNLLFENRFYGHNMDFALRDILKISRNRWSCGGMTARYHGIKKAMEDGYKYYLHLDDDDMWLENHVEEINKSILLFPKSDFIYTYSKYEHTKLPKENIKKMDYNNLIPKEQNIVHSTWCVNLNTLGPLFDKLYTNRIDQINRINQINRMNIHSNKEINYHPFDACLLIAINGCVKKGTIQSLLIPKITCIKESDQNVPV